MNIKKTLKKSIIYKKMYIPFKAKIRKVRIQKDAKKYIEWRYRKSMNREIDWKHLNTYTEKIQSRKLYDNNPLYEICADKVLVRDYVQKKMEQADERLKGCLKFPKWYGTWDDVEKIKFGMLPERFVLKSNHASGHIIICSNKEMIDWKKVKAEMRKWLRINFYYVDAEKHYANIKPQIICEELLEEEIIDYRFFCFKGIPYFVKVTIHNQRAVAGYDEATYYPDWSRVDIIWNKEYGQGEFEQPKKLKEMLEVARILSSDFEFVRVDLYSQGDDIYFSELTFTPNSGFEKDLSYEWDKKLGELWDKGV